MHGHIHDGDMGTERGTQNVSVRYFEGERERERTEQKSEKTGSRVEDTVQ
jgi:hypothetical protein